MKKPLVCFLFAALTVGLVSACQKKEETPVLTKEETMAMFAEKKIVSYEGGEKIVFKTFDGQELKTVTGKDSYSFRDEIPQRKANEKYHYDFAGWDVTYDFDAKETIAKAKYQEVLNEYEVRFIDNGVVVDTQKVPYGSTPIAPEGFEASEDLEPVFKNKTYYSKVRGTGDVGTDGLIFEVIPGNEIAVINYIGLDEDVIIPSSYDGLPITTIETDAFKNGTGVKTIYIPNSIKLIEPNSFRGIESLTAITLEEGNAVYSLDANGGISWQEEFYGEYYKHLLYVPSGKVDLLEISDDYFYIDDGALANTNATILKISTSGFLRFDEIFGGDYAIVRNNVKQLIITDGYLRASMCENMTELYSVTVVDNPELGDYVDTAAFKGCTNLRGIILPSVITTLEDEAFMNCLSLEDVILGFGDLAITTVKKNVFKNCPNIKGYEKDGVVYVGNNEHKYQIPVRITENLVEELEIPADVLAIPDGFFNFNQVLTDLTFEDGSRLKSIGDRAFYGCSNLDIFGTTESPFYHYIPASCEKVGYQAFTNTKYDTSKSAWFWININGTNKKYYMVNLLKNCGAFDIGRYTKFIDPYGLRGGYDSVSVDANNSYDIVVQKSDVLLNSYTFLHCKRSNTTLTSSNFGVIPYMAYAAPYCCNGIALTKAIFLDTSASYSAALSEIGEYAFAGCKLDSSNKLRGMENVIGTGAFRNGINANVTFRVDTYIHLKTVGADAFYSSDYGFTLNFTTDSIPEGWDENFDGANGNNTKNVYRFNQA